MQTHKNKGLFGKGLKQMMTKKKQQKYQRDQYFQELTEKTKLEYIKVVCKHDVILQRVPVCE